MIGCWSIDDSVLSVHFDGSVSRSTTLVQTEISFTSILNE